MSSKLNARPKPILVALAAAMSVAIPAGAALAAQDDTGLTEQAQARAARLPTAIGEAPAARPAQTDAAGQSMPPPLPMALHEQEPEIPLGSMTTAAPGPRRDLAFDSYALAKAYGERALQAIDRADAAILGEDAAGAEKALHAAVVELDHARGLAFRDVFATRSGTVSDLWAPAGMARDGSADSRLGSVAPDRLDAARYGTRGARYAGYLREDGAEVLIPVRDTLANLKTALGCVRHGDFDKAQSAVAAVFDSSVMVSAGMPVHG